MGGEWVRKRTVRVQTIFSACNTYLYKNVKQYINYLKDLLGIMAQACNLGMQKVEAGEFKYKDSSLYIFIPCLRKNYE